MSDRLGGDAAKAEKAVTPIKAAVATPMPLQRCNRKALIALLTAARKPLYQVSFSMTAKFYTALVRMYNVRILRLTSAGVFENTPDKGNTKI